MSIRPFGHGYRLHYRWEYLRFFGPSEVFRARECTIFRIRNDLGHFRLGITLKARGRSVDRNRVKRQIREAFRDHGPDLGSFDYNVVVPGRHSLEHPYPERLRKALNRELENAVCERA